MGKEYKKVHLSSVLDHRKEFVTIDDISTYRRPRVQLHARGIVLRDSVAGSEIKTKQQQVCKAGEFLVAEIDAKVGGFGVVPLVLDGSIVSSHYFLFDIRVNLLDIKFLDYYIRTPAFRDQVEAQGSTNYAAIRPSHVLGYQIPLPPLAEQQRIVARIEELAAKIEEARGLRKLAIEEADGLIHSRRNQIFTNLKERFPGIRLDEVADSRLGKMLDPSSKMGIGSTPYLRNANIQWDRLDLSDVFEMDFSPDQIEGFRLRPGDVLVCEGGDIGKAAMWNGEIEICCYQKALHRIRCRVRVTIPRFLLHHLFWAAREGHWSELKTQTTFAHLTGVKLKSYKMYIPSISEQEGLAHELDSLSNSLKLLTAVQEQSKAVLDALLPSILDRAFRGEL